MDDRDRELEELRAENARLRAQIGRKKRRPIIPEKMMRKHEELYDIVWHEYRGGKAGTCIGIPDHLSLLVRATIFDKVNMKKDPRKKRLITCPEMSDEEYELYTGTVEQILRSLEFGLRAKKSGLTVEQEAAAESIRIGECVYDMAMLAAAMMDDIPEERRGTLDSRDLYQSILCWAREFEDGFDEESEDYLEKIDKFGGRKLREYFDMEV